MSIKSNININEFITAVQLHADGKPIDEDKPSTNPIVYSIPIMKAAGIISNECELENLKKNQPPGKGGARKPMKGGADAEAERAAAEERAKQEAERAAAERAAEEAKQKAAKTLPPGVLGNIFKNDKEEFFRYFLNFGNLANIDNFITAADYADEEKPKVRAEIEVHIARQLKLAVFSLLHHENFAKIHTNKDADKMRIHNESLKKAQDEIDEYLSYLGGGIKAGSEEEVLKIESGKEEELQTKATEFINLQFKNKLIQEGVPGEIVDPIDTYLRVMTAKSAFLAVKDNFSDLNKDELDKLNFKKVTNDKELKNYLENLIEKVCKFKKTGLFDTIIASKNPVPPERKEEFMKMYIDKLEAFIHLKEKPDLPDNDIKKLDVIFCGNIPEGTIQVDFRKETLDVTNLTPDVYLTVPDNELATFNKLMRLRIQYLRNSQSSKVQKTLSEEQKKQIDELTKSLEQKYNYFGDTENMTPDQKADSFKPDSDEMRYLNQAKETIEMLKGYPDEIIQENKQLISNFLDNYGKLLVKYRESNGGEDADAAAAAATKSISDFPQQTGITVATASGAATSRPRSKAQQAAPLGRNTCTHIVPRGRKQNVRNGI